MKVTQGEGILQNTGEFVAKSEGIYDFSATFLMKTDYDGAVNVQLMRGDVSYHSVCQANSGQYQFRPIPTQASANSGPSQFRPRSSNSGRCQLRPIAIQAQLS